MISVNYKQNHEFRRLIGHHDLLYANMIPYYKKKNLYLETFLFGAIGTYQVLQLHRCNFILFFFVLLKTILVSNNLDVNASRRYFILLKDKLFLSNFWFFFFAEKTSIKILSMKFQNMIRTFDYLIFLYISVLQCGERQKLPFI